MEYIKHFDQQSENYLLFRPTYPESLYSYLMGLVKEKDCAWDCATGNGQVAVSLADHFKEVIATDLSQAQLEQAPEHERIKYYCCPADKTSIKTSSVDLITVAQALHWFNFDSFYKEVRRVSKPAACIAVWCYSLGKLHNGTDLLIEELFNKILGKEYWPPERRYIDESYQTIPFPFEKIRTPEFIMEKEVNLGQLAGYLNTWSAVKEYQKRNQRNPVEFILPELEASWGEPHTEYTIRWPLHLLAGYVEK